MTKGDKPVYITRGEFYNALVIIWIYLALVFGELMPEKWRWSIGILWITSFFFIIFYLAQAIRSDKAQKRLGKSL